MSVQRLVGFETGDTSEVIVLGAGCSVVAAPGSGNAGAYAFRNGATSSNTESTLVSGLNTSRLRCSFRFYVGANPGGATDSIYQIQARTAAGALVIDLFLAYDKTSPPGGAGAGWYFSWWDSTDTTPGWAENYVTPGSNPVLGWVTFEIDCQIGASSTTVSQFYTLDSDGIRREIGATGNGTDGGHPATANFGTVNIDKVTALWASTSGAEPFYIDDLVIDDTAVPANARVIARDFVSTAPNWNEFIKSTGSTIDTVWNNTPYNAATYAYAINAGAYQSAHVAPFSATQAGHGSGFIRSGDAIKGVKVGFVAKTTHTLAAGITQVGVAQNGSSTAGGNITLTFNVAPVVGDVVFVSGGFGTAGANNPGISTAGYTALFTDNATAARRAGCWFKIMGTTPDTSVVCLGSGAAGDGVAYTCTVLRQVESFGGSPVHFPATTATGTGTAPNPPAAGASVNNNDWVLAIGASAVNDTSPGTQTNYTQKGIASANATRPFSTASSTRQIATPGTNDDPPLWGSWSAASWVAASITVRSSGNAGADFFGMSALSGVPVYQGFGGGLTTSDKYLEYVVAAPPTILTDLNNTEFGAVKGYNSAQQTIEDIFAMVAYVPGPPAFNDTRDEIAAALDAPTAALARVGAVAETGAALDAPAATAVFLQTVAETAAALDTPTAASDRAGAVAETAAAADTQTAGLLFSASVAETAAALDAPAGTALFSGTVAEIAAALDAPTAALARVGTVAETGAAVDTPDATAVFLPSVAETAAAADTPTAAIAAGVKAVAEPAAAADTQTAGLLLSASVAETAAALDAPAGTALFLGTVAEIAPTLDAPTAALARVGTVAETGAAVDTPAALGIFVQTVAETAAALDTPTAAITAVKAVTETAAALDAPTAAIDRAGAVDETAAAADTQTALGALVGAVAESAAAVDAPTATQVFAPILVAEALSAIDTTSGSLGSVTHNVTVLETATAVDDANATAVFAARNVAEVAAALDGAAVTAVRPATLAEILSALDTPAALGIFVRPVDETAAANDTQTAAIAGVKAVTETAAAADTQTAGSLFSTSVAEIAAALDAPAGTALFPGTVADTAAALDAPTAALARVGAVAETGAAVDTPAALGIFVQTVAETAAALDTPTAAITAVKAVTETAAAADTETAASVRVGAVAETAAALDSPDATTGSPTKVVTEATAALDTSTAILQFVASLAETAAAADAITVKGIWLASVAESAAAIDASISAGPANVSVSEIAAAVDTCTSTQVGSGLNWPDEVIGTKVLLEGISSQRADYGERTEMESGFALVRTRARNPLRQYQATFLFTASEYQFFSAWFEYEAKDSESWFAINLPIDGGTRSVRARILHEPVPTPATAVGDYWKVALKLDVRDTNVISRAALDLSHPDTGAWIFPAMKPLYAGFGNQRRPSGSESEADGVMRFRERIASPFRTVALSWVMTDAELQVFHAWVEYRARYQAAFWNIDLNIDGAERTFRARFISQPTQVYGAPGYWRVSAELEVRDPNFWSRADYEFIRVISPEDMFAMLDAIDDLTLDPYFSAWDDADDYVWVGDF